MAASLSSARLRIGLAALAALAAGCDGSRAPLQPPIPSRVDAALLEGEAAAALDARGLFRLAAPPPEATPRIDEAQARAIAAAWLRTGAPMVERALERERRAPIDLAALAPCERAYFGDSPYEAAGAEASPQVRRAYGPYWFVSLCDGPVPAISLAVSAYATDARVEAGDLALPRGAFGLLVTAPVPPGGALPLTPEGAAQIAAEVTGRRVGGVPSLLVPAAEYPRPSLRPQAATWRVTLAAPARVRPAGAAADREVREVFVGIRYASDVTAEVSVAALDQPDDREVVIPAMKGPGGAAAGAAEPAVRLRRKPTHPVKLELVRTVHLSRR